LASKQLKAKLMPQYAVDVVDQGAASERLVRSPLLE
jgi:hypothetical protein